MQFTCNGHAIYIQCTCNLHVMLSTGDAPEYSSALLGGTTIDISILVLYTDNLR